MSNQMQFNQVHGHEVMQMMAESAATYTRESLLAAIRERFGPETRFYTCAGDNMTAEELIDFLAARGKFVQTTDGFALKQGDFCQHE